MAEQLNHGFPQSLTHQKIGLGIAKFVVPVARIGRILWLSHKGVGFHELNGARKFREGGAACLGFAKCIPRSEGLYPRPGEFAYHHRQPGRLKVFSNIPNQIGKVVFIFGNRFFRIHAIIPTLVPDKPGQLNPLALVAGKLLGNVGQGMSHLFDHFCIVRSNLTS